MLKGGLFKLISSEKKGKNELMKNKRKIPKIK